MKIFNRCPLWIRLIWLSAEAAIVIYAIYTGTTTTVLYQGF